MGRRNPVNRWLDVACSFALSSARLGAGLRVSPLGERPEKSLELFEFEACPFCRKVREALSCLDLEAVIYPCPKNGPTYRPQVAKEGGKMQFPFLKDPNTGASLYESDEIVRYLFEKYGKGPAPFLCRGGTVNQVSGFLAAPLRGTRGLKYMGAKKPVQMIELYSFEGSPYCRIVREVLCSLEIPYKLHNVAKGSPSRKAFVERSGKMMVPYLVDPNTNTSLFESEEIKEYLLSRYAFHGG
jgi:glutathione S-transferase